MASARPCNREHFADIYGVGDIKLEKYGSAFISEIRNVVGAALE
jgi:superfamily II DNA helicase RecQ